MSEKSQADIDTAAGPAGDPADPIERLGFPGPPQRIVRGRSQGALAVGFAAIGLLLLVGLGLPVAYFGFDAVGRGLVVDTALAVGLGTPLAGANVSLGDCEYNATRPGSKLPGSWHCAVSVAAGEERTTLFIETTSRIDDPAPRGAGRVFGATGVYWPVGTLAARWWNASILLLIGGGLVWLGVAALGWSGEARRLSRARGGTVRAADLLLNGTGRPWFAFADETGMRRVQRAGPMAPPLMLDSLHTRGAAIVSGRSAVLLAGNLLPLQLEPARREAIYARLLEVQRESQVRRLLVPQPGDPSTLAERIAAIEHGLAGRPDGAALARLYDAAWRLVWDGDDAAIAERALAARAAIAKRLGPRATLAALEDCRRRHG